jgi:hypothetical protein
MENLKLKTVVSYYMKNQPKQYKVFNRRSEAVIFCQALAINPDCECYGIERFK